MKKKLKAGLVIWGAALILMILLPTTALAEDMGSFTVTGGTLDTDYTYFSDTLVILTPGDYTISGAGNGQERILIEASGTTADDPVHITLSGVDIQLDTSVADSALKVQPGVYARLTLVGDNRLISTGDYAGLRTVGAWLTIDGSGALIAEGGARGAGIGGNNGEDGGDVTVLSGYVTAYSANYGAGIGGGFGGNGGTVAISGGEVTAISAYSGAGIGGGSQNPSGNGGNGGSVTISGGRVIANGETYGAGIGGGMNGDGGSITISGGQVLASANYNGAGIGGGLNGDGGTIDISSGDVEAQGGCEGGAGVGGGSGGDGGSITISGGELTALSLGYGAAIGGGSGGGGGTINISGTADIVARGDDYGSGIGQGAGIGGGYNGGGGTINISGAAVVKATGGDYAAGIGGGAEGDGHGGTISISGTANIFARGGGYAAGIGGGKDGNGGTISISDTAIVDTAGGDYGAGIGGGNMGNGGSINISGSRITAVGGGNSAGIGGGSEGDGGIISISGGTIKATGTGEGAGIGGGSQGDGAAVTITGGSIYANSGAALPSEYGIGGGFNGSAGTVRDGSGRDVYLTYVTLEGVSAATGVTSLTVDSGAYGINDMYTDEYGGLSLYLPNGAHTTDARTAGKRYTGNVTTWTDLYNSYGTLMWYRQIDADGTYSIGGYYASGKTLHIDGGLDVTLTGSAGTVYANFQVECGAGVRLTVENVNIDNSGHDGSPGLDGGFYFDNGCPLSFTGAGNTLLLNSVNTMKAGRYVPGIRAEQGTLLTIDGVGSLTATGGLNAAGIGGSDSGTVTISGGTVTATGGSSGAGIGGGEFGNGGTVTITGGIVTATGGSKGAGIGGGQSGGGGTVMLSGGVTFAAGNGGGKDIGAGYTGSGGSLNLSGTAALFLRNDNSVVPVTTTHTHRNYTGHDGGSIYGIPVAWTGDFGAHLRIYTLSYNANGGSGTVAPVTQLYNTTTTVSDGGGLSRTGYTFAGWNTAANGGGTAYAPGSTFTFSADTLLYAQWTVEPFTFTYNLDGGTVSPANPVSYTIESNAITLKNPTKAGYTFVGWSGTGITGTAMNVTIPKGSTGNRAYAAHWTANAYTVTFNSQGGSAVASKTAQANTTITAPANPARSGYTFGGWYKQAACINVWNFASDKVTSNITLFAKWTSNTKYTITATPNSKSYGSVTGAGSYPSGTAVTLKAIPKSGYRFVQWLEGSKAVSYSAEYQFTVSKSRTLKAEFARIGTPKLRASATGYDSVKLTWGAVTGAKEYVVYRSTSKYGTYSNIATTAGMSYTNTGLNTGTTYYYKVKAKCVAGSTTTYGSYSYVQSAKPALAKPSSVKAASASYTSIQISWGDVPGVTKYQVYRAKSKYGSYSRLTETTSASFTNTSLTTGKTYYYKVRAYRLVGKTKVYSKYSAIVSAKPVPAAPTGVTAARESSTSIMLTWSGVSGATKYKVYRATSKNGTYRELAETSSTSYISTGLTAGKTYYYKVRAYHLEGRTKVYGPYSAIVSAKP